MKRKHLILGLALLGSGVLLSSPLLRSNIEANLRRRVEHTLAEAPNDRYQEVLVTGVDHLDVSLGGTATTQKDVDDVGPFVQHEVPGVGRVFSDVKVRPAFSTPDAQIEPAAAPIVKDSTAIDDKENSVGAKELVSKLDLFEDLPAEPTSESKKQDNGQGNEQSDDLPQESGERGDNRIEQNAETPLQPLFGGQEATPVESEPILDPVPHRDQVSTLRLGGDRSSWAIGGNVADQATIDVILDAVRSDFPDAEIKNELVVGERIQPAAWAPRLSELTSALRDAGAKGVDIRVVSNSKAVIRGEVENTESFKLVAGIAANVFGPIVSTELSVNATEQPSRSDVDMPSEELSNESGESPFKLANETLDSEFNDVMQGIDASPDDDVMEEATETPVATHDDEPVKPRRQVDVIQALLGDSMIVIGRMKHLERFQPNAGASSICLLKPTSTSTQESSSLSLQYSAPRSVAISAGSFGVAVKNGLPTYSTNTICSKKTLSKPKCSVKKLMPCPRTRN